MSLGQLNTKPIFLPTSHIPLAYTVLQKVSIYSESDLELGDTYGDSESGLGDRDSESDIEPGMR